MGDYLAINKALWDERAPARLVEWTETDIDFHEAEVYAAVDVLDLEAFDLVYTGIGALCWLPEAARWARFVADLLRPGGRLFIREGHPMLWSLDETSDPVVYDKIGTYVG